MRSTEEIKAKAPERCDTEAARRLTGEVSLSLSTVAVRVCSESGVGAV